MPTDGYIQVAPDSTGKKVRNLEGVAVVSDGTQNVVEMQVTAAVNPDGKLVDPDTTRVLDTLYTISETLEDILEVLTEALNSDTRQAQAKKGGRHFSMVNRRR